MSGIQLRFLPTYPANISGQGVVKRTVINGAYVITIDYTVLAPATIDNLASFSVPVVDMRTGAQALLSLSALSAFGSSLAVTETGNRNVSTTDTYIRCNLAAASTFNLPKASTRNGLDLEIKDVAGNFSTRNLTIVPNGTETIDGLGSLVGSQNYQFIKLRPNSAGWEITHFG